MDSASAVPAPSRKSAQIALTRRRGVGMVCGPIGTERAALPRLTAILMPIARRHILLLLTISTVAGCAGPALRQGKSPLMPAQMSSDAVVLEMFFVRCPFGDPTINDKLWQEIDEQQIPAELRERLARNGFRVGVVEGRMPIELSKLLEMSDQSPPEPADKGKDQGDGKTEGEAGDKVAKVNDFSDQPRVVHRRLDIRPGQRGEIIASGTYDQLPVLLCESGRVSGKTYNQAQGIFEIKQFPRPDGRVRLQLVPELHHDQMRQRWVGGQGMLRMDVSRPKQVYEEMTLSADLAPGDMLILASLPNRPGSLGHYFFTEKDGRLEQKLLVIRLAQTQNDGLFNPPEPLKLEEE